MTRGDSLEIIEIIDDDAGAFGDRHNDATTNGTTGSRWAGPVAAAALLGLIAFGVVTSTGGAPKVAPITSISVAPQTTVTAPAPATSTAAPPTVSYYAAEPPREYSVRYADRQPFANDFGLVDYQLWATPDSSATTGSWFSASTSPGAPAVYATDSYRLQAGDLSIAMSRTPSGHALTQFTSTGHVGVTIASFGWSDDNLLRLATSVQASQDGIEFTDNWFKSDHQQISSQSPWLAISGLPVEQIVYSSSEDLSDAVVVTVGQPPPPNEGVGADARQVALRFLLDRNTPFTVDGHSAVAGTVIGHGNYSIATWLDGDNIITVGSTVPLSQLITIARSVHQVPTSVWAGMQFQAQRNTTTRTVNDAVPAATVASGTDADGGPWTIDVMVDPNVQRQLDWLWGARSTPTTAGDIAAINTVVEDKRTYVLADLPRAVAQTAELHVLRDGLDPMVISFNIVDPILDRTFAAVAFTEPGPYTAEIVGPDGTVYARWPSS